MKKWFSLSLLLLTLMQVSLFAQDGGEVGPSREQGIWQTVVMIFILLVFFYFILWRPEQKRRKALEEQRTSLKQGDRVVAMGIVGTVLRIQEQTVILKMYDGSKVEFLKGAVTEVNPETAEESAKTEKQKDSSEAN